MECDCAVALFTLHLIFCCPQFLLFRPCLLALMVHIAFALDIAVCIIANSVSGLGETDTSYLGGMFSVVCWYQLTPYL